MPRNSSKNRWSIPPVIKNIVLATLALAAGFFTYRMFHDVDPALLSQAISDIPMIHVALALFFVAVSYTTLSRLDILAVRRIGKLLPSRVVAIVSFISYAFNFNFGVLLGGFAVRYRLYGKLGLNGKASATISASTMAASFLSFAFVAGCAHLITPLTLPDSTWVPMTSLKSLGLAELMVGVVLVVVFWIHPESVQLGSKRFVLPELRGIYPQVAVAALQWLLLSAILFSILPSRTGITYVDVLAVQTLASIAAMIMHVPAGLGAFEGTLVMMFGSQISRPELLGSIIIYRCLYHLTPLILAGILFLVVEKCGFPLGGDRRKGAHGKGTAST